MQVIGEIVIGELIEYSLPSGRTKYESTGIIEQEPFDGGSNRDNIAGVINNDASVAINDRLG